MGFRNRWAAALTAAGLLALGAPTALAHADAPAPYRTDLRVLVVDDGGPTVAAITAELAGEGIPYTKVNVYDAGRPTINAAFLTGTAPDGGVEAKYQAVVLCSAGALGTGSAETTALNSYEQTYNVRQVDANTYPQPAVGMNWPQNPGYLGALDGLTGQVTAAGSAGAFGYLGGAVPFEDNNPALVESYGFLSTPLATEAAGASFTPLVTMTIPGTTAAGSLVGDYQHDGHDELVTTFAFNQYQQQWRLLARGMVDWMTQGVHLGYDRDYLSVQVDDTMLNDSRWSVTRKCTQGESGCTPDAGSIDGTPIRMTAADVDYAKQWEAANGLTLDLAVDGSGSDAVVNNTGTDPTEQEFAADASSFRWIDGSYGRGFLGCLQNVTVVPWACSTDATGATRWTSQATINTAIQNNLSWAQAKGIPVDPTTLVTNQNSGLAIQPQQPVDNPSLAPALSALGITSLASNASAEPASRQVGSAVTVPRSQLDVYYNAATAAEEADEYNWLYTAAAQGGSGACTGSATSTCLAAPVDETAGYQSTIVPTEAKIAMQRVLGNDPTPQVLHQSNFAEERIAYPLLDQILATHQGLLNADTPLVNLSMRDIATQLQNESAWNAAVAAGSVTAYRIGSTVTVSAPDGVQVPVTTPSGAVQVHLSGSTGVGTSYAGELSGWLAPDAGQGAVTVQTVAAPALPAAARGLAHPRTAAAPTAVVARPAEPATIARPVPFGPDDSTRLTAARR